MDLLRFANVYVYIDENIYFIKEKSQLQQH